MVQPTGHCDWWAFLCFYIGRVLNVLSTSYPPFGFIYTDVIGLLEFNKKYGLA